MKKLLPLACLGLVLLGSILYLSLRPSEAHVLSGKVFGSYYRIVTRDDISAHQAEIEQVFARINEEMSVFEPNSLVNQINKAPQGSRFQLSPELARLLKESQLVYQLSQGAYDPTVEPLVDLWGFGKSKKRHDVTPESLAAARAKVGFDGLELQGHELIKKRAGLSLDLSSVAKGYAVDALAALLDQNGIADYMVDIGGELKSKGKSPAQGKDWQAGIQAPDEQGIAATMSIPLRNMAIATSGDYRRVLSDGTKAYSHIINPKTGYPARSDFASVSVVHPSAMVADIYATALMAMPSADAVQLANEQGLAVIFILHTQEETSYRVLMSRKALDLSSKLK